MENRLKIETAHFDGDLFLWTLLNEAKLTIEGKGRSYSRALIAIYFLHLVPSHPQVLHVTGAIKQYTFNELEQDGLIRRIHTPKGYRYAITPNGTRAIQEAIYKAREQFNKAKSMRIPSEPKALKG